MDIAVRLASLPDEQELLIDILDRNLPGRANREIQEKRHANPLGPGWSWLIYSRSRSNEVGGMASVFRRSFWMDGKQVLCGQVIEFAIEAPFRSLGPAVLLQRATLEPVRSGEVQFGYDCPPDARGMSTFLRLGMCSVSDLHRYVLLLRSDEYLEKRLGKKPWTPALIATANEALKLRRSGRNVPGIEICKHETSFGHEFTALDRAVSSTGMVRAARSADDLNWRYQNDRRAMNSSTDVKYQVLVARKSGELTAFVVFLMQPNRVAWVLDIFGLNLSASGSALMDAVIAICRRERMLKIETLSSVQRPLSAILSRCGFRRRERVYSVVPYDHAGQHSGLLDPPSRWTFSNFEVMY